MSRAGIFLLSCVVAAAGCGRGAEAPRSVDADVRSESDAYDINLDAGNLLNLASGAAVASRTGEIHLESSAVHAIDGIGRTLWSSPPGDPNQTLVLSLGAPSRIERLGVTTVDEAHLVQTEVRFEASLDGESWREVLVFEPKPLLDPQLADVTPFEARYLRVTTSHPQRVDVRLRSIHALGTETALPAPPRFGGCWTINGNAARLVQRGSHLAGIVLTDPPTRLLGDVEGRVARLMWMRGYAWGYLALTLTPDGERLSGLQFHEEVAIGHATAGWFGTRRPACDALAASGTAAEDILRQAGRWSMYGIAFDQRDRLINLVSRETLDTAAALIAATPSQRFRVVARELREKNVEKNRTRAEARIRALRAAFETRGTDLSRVDFSAISGEWEGGPEIEVALQRVMASRVDLELVR